MQPHSRHADPKAASAARATLESALRGLEDRTSPEALVLEAKLHLLREDAAAVIRLLSDQHFADRRLRLEQAFLLASAYARSGAADKACEQQLKIEGMLDEIDSSNEFNLQSFQALKALGWSYALRGDYFNAFRYLKKSTAYAPSAASEAIAAMDRAYLARCLNEERWSCQELSEAEELAETVDWRSTNAEERAGLLLLAELVAAIDAGRAAGYMALFRELGEERSPEADYSAGVTHLALEDTNTGVNLLRESFTAYDGIGYDWRAARCALRLFEATNDAKYLRVAAEKLHRYPNSWLADEVRKHAKVKAGMPALPPMQQRVFEELCRGLSTAEIARNLERSEYTIKNHIKLIFKAFSVKSRAQLIAQVARRAE